MADQRSVGSHDHETAMPALHCFCHASLTGRKVDLTCLSACYYTPSNPKHSDTGIFLAFPDSNKLFSFSQNCNSLNNATWLPVIVAGHLEMLKSGGNICLRMNSTGIWSFLVYRTALASLKFY